jgi:hypothetical protein
MNDKQPEHDPKAAMIRDSLKVTDLVRYLSHLAKLHNVPRIGNPELSKGLQVLSEALKPYSKMLLKELQDALTENPILLKDKGKTPKLMIELPPNLESLNANVVGEILDNQDYTKIQIIDLGVKRFGISHSKLVRLNKKSATESVRAALDHEKSLGVISQEARLGGDSRSS